MGWLDAKSTRKDLAREVAKRAAFGYKGWSPSLGHFP
jgi:hypothetical protein